MLLRRISVIAAALLLSGSGLRAQDGMVITLRGDTLQGRIVIEPREQIDQIQIRASKKTTLTARQVRRVTIGTTSYLPVAYDRKIRLMKILIEGYVTLLNFQSSHNSFTYDGSLLLRADGVMLEVPRLNFRKELPEFIEAPGLTDSIATGKLTLADIELIVRRYNTHMDRMTEMTATRNKAVSAYEPARFAMDELIGTAEQSDFPERQEALQIMADIRQKFSHGENVPPYAVRAMNAALATQPALREKWHKIVLLIPGEED